MAERGFPQTKRKAKQKALHLPAFTVEAGGKKKHDLQTRPNIPCQTTSQSCKSGKRGSCFLGQIVILFWCEPAVNFDELAANVAASWHLAEEAGAPTLPAGLLAIKECQWCSRIYGEYRILHQRSIRLIPLSEKKKKNWPFAVQ